MAINAGDVLTYDGSKWVNQPTVQGPFGVGTAPVYQFHAVQGLTGLFFTGTTTSLAGLYNSNGKQWSLRVDGSTNRLDIRDDNAGGLAERITVTTPGGNVGVGTTSPTSLLHVAGAIATALANKTAAYTLTATDSVVTGDATSAAFTVTLPTAVGITGRIYTVKKIDSSANAVTVGTTSGQTIDGAATYVLSTRWQFVAVVSNGANWIIVAK
jgi:hypothetical protein